MPESIPEEILFYLPVPYQGSLVSLFRALLDFVPKHAEFVEKNEEYQLKMVKLIHTVNLRPKAKRRADIAASESQDPAEKNLQEKLPRESFSRVFMELLKLRLTRAVHVKILLHIHDRIIPNLSRPLLLADYLVTTFAQGGILSILALNGLFTLIQKYHLDFPQFYERFYVLLSSQILVAKFRARFFHLADLFMGSSHIPAYTVAAVAKRISRLSLTAPADSLPLLLTFAMNLIIRHPTLLSMIHKPDDATDVESDPYQMDEQDMQKCRALDSSLWELKTPKEHYNAQVRKLAEYLDHKLPETEFDVTEYLELDTGEMMEEIKEKMKDTTQDEPAMQLKVNSKAVSLFPKNSLFNSVFVI